MILSDQGRDRTYVDGAPEGTAIAPLVFIAMLGAVCLAAYAIGWIIAANT